MFRQSLLSRGRDALRQACAAQLTEIQNAGTMKIERVITSPQSSAITVQGGSEKVLNFCANNYLGFSNHPEVVKAAQESLSARGFGMSSVRFICGTQDVHRKLEDELTDFLGTEDTILYPSCFDANAGVFEAVLGPEDAVISDALNHASIIDGIRLCKAERHRYAHLDLAELEEILKKTESKRIKLVVTDGVFSMDGDVAPLDKITALTEKYGANLFVDDSHATGFMGKGGRGTPSLFGVQDRVDILNSTLGKAMGGASGGFSSGCKELVKLQRNKGRPYLFSNTMAPCVAAGTSKALELLRAGHSGLTQLESNTKLFREAMEKEGFKLTGHPTCPIVPVMLGDAKIAADFAEKMLKEGIYVIAFSFPVVPKGQARIRVQLGASHSTEEVKRCIDAFIACKKQFGM